ncbi:hypothetical protein PGT21_030989 [Puccinia graminis f. sp. tritici]|uniref:hAT-like transposase RNase-H fold domain-containing protein n=1 Tax=Puccinia graminis f. sp. tritici TaxID=56615 RepID=A0A5B0NPV6_PUCGR|nr:hypothetical protein PGT21_030989 [Puccinia graminis f. sp. tritici]
MSRKSYGLGISAQPSLPGNELRRSSRVSSTTSRHPSIILPPSDSRRSVNRPLPATQKTNNKQTRSVPPSETEASDQEIPIDKNPTKNQQNTKKKKTNQKKKKTIQQNNSDAGSIIDLREDSDADNSKIPAAKPRPEKYDSPLEFFGEPFYPAKTTEEERKKKPITYNCKWCKKQVRGGHNSDANLRKHRDGSNQTGRDGSGCPNRSLAIQAGAKIPPTVNETRAQAEKNDNGGPKLTAFFGRMEKFDKKILNQILMIWQTRNALPWSRIEDFDLQAAFHYCQSDAILFKRKWVASEAKQLYVLLQGAMLQMLKIALIVNAGLAELGMIAPPPSKVKESILGTFPYSDVMETIAEVEEEMEEDNNDQANGPDHQTNPSIDDDEISEPEHDEEELARLGDQQDKEEEDNNPGEYQAANRNESNRLDHVTRKLDFVVRKITSTSAWRQVFIRKTNKKGLKLRSLIPGYGIRWNIKFESRERAYEAREVIDEILKEDLEKVHAQRARQRGRTSQKELGHFQEMTILSHEWQEIKELNDELKKMEGDGPTGSAAIPEYLQMKNTLKKKLDSSNRNDPLHPMFVKMFEKTNTYLLEALACETLVISTILNPSFRLAIFEKHFPKEALDAKKRLVELFEEIKNQMAEKIQQEKEREKDTALKEKETNEDDIYSFFSGPSNNSGQDEIEMYLGGVDRIIHGNKKDYMFSALNWWKVCFSLASSNE